MGPFPDSLRPPFPFQKGKPVALRLLGQGFQEGFGLLLVAGFHQAFGVKEALFPEEGGGELGEEGLHPFHQGPALPLGEEKGEGFFPQGKVHQLFLGKGAVLQVGEEAFSFAKAAWPHQIAVPPLAEGGLEGLKGPLLAEEGGSRFGLGGWGEPGEIANPHRAHYTRTHALRGLG